jgi:hypothetical protein
MIRAKLCAESFLLNTVSESLYRYSGLEAIRAFGTGIVATV